MVDSTSSTSNMHEVFNDNSNPHTSMIMNEMRINQDYMSGCSIIDEEPNIEAILHVVLLST